MPWFDTHCHVNHADFDGDREAVLARARAAGVGRLMVIGYDRPTIERALAMADGEAVVAAIGFHPSEADAVGEADLAWLEDRLSHPHVKAVGEIGIDLHWRQENLKRQEEVFRAQLEIARARRLPVVIHQRDAAAEVYAILDAYPDVRGILHCFTGDRTEMRRALSLPFLFGFGGAVTFRRNDALREVVRAAPAERLVLETDAPYLAPVPHRGRRNEPAYLVHVAETVAELRGMALPELAALTWQNAVDLLGA